MDAKLICALIAVILTSIGVGILIGGLICWRHYRCH